MLFVTPVTRGRNDLWGGLLLAVGLVFALTAFVGVSLFRVALVGFFVWLAVARSQGWAWIPAGILGIGIVSDVFDGVGGSLVLPVLVIAAGVLLLARDRLSGRATTWILIGLLATGAYAANRDGRSEPPRLEPPAALPDERPAAPEAPDPASIPALKGRELEIRGANADIELAPSRSARGTIVTDSDFDIAEEDDVVVVSLGSGDYRIGIPAEADVLVITDDGDVSAHSGAFDLEVESISGDIDLDLGGSSEVQIEAETRRGSIRAGEDLEDRDPSAQLFLHGDRGPRLSLSSRRGDISISRAA